MKVIIIGYMASGKSSIGKKLSKIIAQPFIDLDDYIVEKEALSIPNIFKLKGEIYFRKKESEYLNELLQKRENFILAVGGGTPCYGNNMNIINKKAKSVYLNASIKTIYGKLSKIKNKKRRPLIAEISNKNLQEFIAKHLFERRPYYEQATCIINIDNKTKKEIATEISLDMQ